MGTILTVAGADFSANAIGYNAPVTRGLTGLYLLGNSQAQSVKNLAPGGVSGSVVNAPTISSGFISAGSFGVSFSGSISGNALTVTSVNYGTLAIGQSVYNSSGTINYGTITGGSGTSWTLSGAGATVASTTLGAAQLGYINSGLLDSTALTVITAFRPPANVGASPASIAITGNLNGSTGFDVYMGSSISTSVTGYIWTEPTGGGSAVIKGPSVPYVGTPGNSFNMVAMTIDPVAATATMFNLTTGVTGAPVALAGTYIQSTAPFQIGAASAANAASFGLTKDLAFFELHDVVLTPTELTALYNAMKPVLVNRGIAGI